jgi:hypothetical protein
MTSKEARMKYEALLRQLDELDKKGLNDSNEADVLRDKMDEPWWCMSDEDQEAMRKLSADLYGQR